MDAALLAADLLVGRAGSSTLAEASAAGLPMIVVPYPHAAAHQRANAAEMVDAGAALLVDDADLDGDTLRQACDLLFDDRLAAMAEAARSVGRPGAAVASAELLVALAKGEPLPAQSELDAIVGAQPA
jgi:UDP-N-acetylglucosamine--N-acetylmuramyl-(pentapeptide) pyrophosphoryl-undecaprenol N-acetylglucosamine transferase